MKKAITRKATPARTSTFRRMTNAAPQKKYPLDFISELILRGMRNELRVDPEDRRWRKEEPPLIFEVAGREYLKAIDDAPPSGKNVTGRVTNPSAPLPPREVITKGFVIVHKDGRFETDRPGDDQRSILDFWVRFHSQSLIAPKAGKNPSILVGVIEPANQEVDFDGSDLRGALNPESFSHNRDWRLDFKRGRFWRLRNQKWELGFSEIELWPVPEWEAYLASIDGHVRQRPMRQAAADRPAATNEAITDLPPENDQARQMTIEKRKGRRPSDRQGEAIRYLISELARDPDGFDGKIQADLERMVMEYFGRQGITLNESTVRAWVSDYFGGLFQGR